MPIADFIDGNVPEVREIARVKLEPGPHLRIGNRLFTEKNFIWADQSLLDFFKIEVIYGSSKSALIKPNSIVLSAKRAKALFPDQNAVGQLMFVDTLLFTVTAVMADMPDNVHLRPEMIGSLSTFNDLSDPWKHQGYLYLKLRDQSAATAVASKINSALRDKIWWLQTPPSFELQGVADIHLHSSEVVASPASSDIKYLYVFAVIGLILVLSTAFNYVSLSIATLSSRNREIAVRKVLGAGKGNLMMQPLSECFILSLLAAVTAAGTLYLILPYVNMWLHIELGSDFVFGFNSVFIFCAVFLLVFFLSAAYPSLAIAHFAAKGPSIADRRPTDKALLRKILITAQFMIAMVLMVSLVAIRKQLDYLGERKLGFDKEQIVVLKTSAFDDLNTSVIKNGLLQIPAVSDVTVCTGTPFGGGFITTEKTSGSSFEVSEFMVDDDYIRTLGMVVVTGRDFTSSDSSDVIVNEALVREMNWDHPIGQRISALSGKDMTVIGVVKDFHLNDPHLPVRPVVLSLGKKYTNNLLVRLDTKDLSASIAQILDQWKKLQPNHPLDYSFLNEEFNALYKSEMQFKNISGVFCAIAIFIACLGLYAYTAYSTQQRTKEIGVRKVLGASLPNILVLIGKDFIQLLMIAFVMCVPIAWYVIDRWLEAFPYRVGVSWSFFVGAGLTTTVIALVTVSIHSIKAALVNPVDSLRSE
jgi:putative ABC transport system permease protein